MSASPVSAHQQQQIIQSAGGEDLSMYICKMVLT